MTLKTVTVTGQIYNPDGTPAAGVEGYATLNRPETDNGIVIPTSTFIKADEAGQFSIQLWPNARGSGQSQYIVRAYTRRASVLNLVIMVPDVDVPVVITDIAIAQPYPPIDQSLQALLDVQAASVIAQAAKVEALAAEAGALASAQSAAGSATSAGQSAQTAGTKAQEAGTSAQLALESKNAAALSEQNAGEAKDDAVAAKDKAEAWAENPVDDEVEPGQYSAKHHAIKAGQSEQAAAQSKADAEAAKGIAEEKALAASGSATLAGQSASNAAESALSASEDRAAAQQSAEQASDSADEAAASKTKAQQWASNPENTAVENGLFSALHYSAKAGASATNAATSEGNALIYKDTAETAKTDAQSARDKAAQWAENPTDTEVEPGQYSAKHHASKAADSANEAEQSAQAASNSAASVDASVIPLPNRIPKSNIEGLLDDGWMNLAPLRVQVLNALYPDGIYPSLDLRFVGADRINNPNVSFSRASKATYWDKDGILREAGIDEPRFDYDPLTGEALGLLVEGQATNNYGITVPPVWTNCEPIEFIQHDRNLNAYKVTAPVDERGGGHWFVREGSTLFPVDGTVFSVSITVKRLTDNIREIMIGQRGGSYFPGSSNRSIFSFEEEAFTNEANIKEPGKVESLGDGYFRITRIGEFAYRGIGIAFSNENGDFSFENDALREIIIADIQVSPSIPPYTYIPTYIPTTDTPATRASEIVTIPTSSFGYNTDRGTLVVTSATPVGELVAKLGDVEIYSDSNEAKEYRATYNTTNNATELELGVGTFKSIQYYNRVLS